MIKFILGFVALVISNTLFANTLECSGVAMQKAMAKYVVESGTIQGSDGAQVSVELALKAKSPFHNYIVSIYDNNEDGETWTVYYFVMSKFENNSCKVLKVVQTEEAALKINSFYDFENQIETDLAKDYILNRQQLSDYRVSFKDLINQDNSICYIGDAQWVLDIIEELLYNHDSSDSIILNSTASLQNGRIVHFGTYTEGSGDHDFSLDFEIHKCK